MSGSRETLWTSGKIDKRTECISKDPHFLGPINIEQVFIIYNNVCRFGHILKKSLIENFIFFLRCEARNVKFW